MTSTDKIFAPTFSLLPLLACERGTKKQNGKEDVAAKALQLRNIQVIVNGRNTEFAFISDLHLSVLLS